MPVRAKLDKASLWTIEGVSQWQRAKLRGTRVLATWGMVPVPPNGSSPNGTCPNPKLLMGLMTVVSSVDAKSDENPNVKFTKVASRKKASKSWKCLTQAKLPPIGVY